MATKRDYYQVLGLKRDASEKEIRQAYRRLARKHHPDLNPSDKAAEANFKEISEAYEVLSDLEKRHKYDRFGHQWSHLDEAGRTGFNSGGFHTRTRDFSDLEDLFGGAGTGGGFGSGFEDLLRGGGTGRGARVHFEAMPGQDVEQPVTVTLEEAYSGATRVISSRAADGSQKRIEVRIPPGVRDGSRIRVAAEGAPGPFGGPRGDLYLIVSIAPHAGFERVSDDLTVKAPVPLHIAVLGGEVEVPTLRGTKLALRIPPETQNGRKIRLRSQGMPILGGSGHGDLYAEVSVVIPTHLSEEERDLFRRLADLRERARVATP